MPIIEGNIFTSDQRPFVDFDPDSIKEESLGEYMLNRLEEEHSKKLLFVDSQSQRRWTGRELKDRILRVATSLVEDYNFQQGQVVCISYDNCDWSIILGLAVILAGGTVSGAFAKDPYAELLYQARRVRPKFLFCHSENLSWAQQLEKDLNYPVVGMAMDSEQFQEFINPSRERSISPLLPVACKDIATDVAFITMSSGTTGHPKAVPVTHKNCLSEVKVGPLESKPEVRACTASFDYVSGRLSVLSTIHRGNCTIILDGFEPKEFLETIQTYAINSIHLGVASLYQLITYKDLNQYDLSSVRLICPVGAKLTYMDKMREFLAKYPNIKHVAQFYGTSEISVCTAMVTTAEQFLTNYDCAGKLMPLMRARIVDCSDSRKALGKNKSGSLRVQGPTVFPGYYDLSLSGRKGSPFVSDPTVHDELGFYITGDLAYFDDDERLYIVGREKELMSCRGAKKVVPQELEELVAKHPAVSNVSVVGIPNVQEPSLHCPRAFIQLRPEYCNCEKVNLMDDIMKFVNDRIGWEKQLTGGILFLDRLPTMRETGKVDKKFLRSL